MDSKANVEHAPSLPDLEKPKEKQSVRTTFRLTHDALEAKEWLADYWGITQKEAIDELADALPDLLPEVPDNLWEIDPYRQDHGVRKTLVISQRAKDEIERHAEAYDRSRDAVLELTLRFVWRLLEDKTPGEEREKKHEEALEMVSDAVEHVTSIESQLGELLGSDDPVYIRFRIGVQILMNLEFAIHEELENGVPVDPDDWSQAG